MTTAPTYAEAAIEFGRVQSSRFIGSGVDIEIDLINLKALGDMIHTAHSVKAMMYNSLRTAQHCLRHSGEGYIGRYDIACACQAEIDYLEITPEASMVVEARVAELLAGK